MILSKLKKLWSHIESDVAFIFWAIVEGVIMPVKEWWPYDNESKK